MALASGAESYVEAVIRRCPQVFKNPSGGFAGTHNIGFEKRDLVSILCLSEVELLCIFLRKCDSITQCDTV